MKNLSKEFDKKFGDSYIGMDSQGKYRELQELKVYKRIKSFIRQREKELQSEIEDKVWKVLKNARIDPKDELWFMDVNDEILKELSND